MIDLRQNKGFALSLSLLFIFLVVSFMAVYMLAVANGVSTANRTANLKRAYYVADAGLADAYERIRQSGINAAPASSCTNASVPSTCSSPFIPSSTTDNGVYAIGNTAGSYMVSVQVSGTSRTVYTITSTGTYGNVSKTLQLKIGWASISKYAYWSQTESNPAFGGGLWWVGVGLPGLEMITTGPVQTNGQLNIFGNPIFNGSVAESNLPILSNGTLGTAPTSSSPNYYYGLGTSGLQSNPATIFPDGIQNEASPVTLPPQTTLNLINSVASDGQGMVMTGPSTIIFNADGTINVTGNITTGAVTGTVNNKNMSPPANGVIYVQSDPGQQDGNATVQGTVNGQLTVAADQNIYLSGSVAYNEDPRPTAANPAGNPTSTDMLGLVANQNITVIENTAPTQLEVSGVMLAMQGSFQVDQYWVYRGDANTAVMDQFGSLVNYVCGATGEMDMSGDLLGGWNQIQSYDSRLATTAPPGFPPIVDSSGNAVYTKLGIQEL